MGAMTVNGALSASSVKVSFGNARATYDPPVSGAVKMAVPLV